MSESKYSGPVDGPEEEFATEQDAGRGSAAPNRHAASLLPPKQQGNGWEAYRRWLTRVQVPGGRRAPLDPSIYTWKGYRNWSDRVRRDWKPDEK